MSGARRVIVGASGSPGSLRALRHAEDLARHGVATLIPVLAWAPPGGDLAARRQPYPALADVWEEAAWQRLWAALEAAWGQIPDDLAVQPVVQRGEAGQVLVDYAGPDDLLVVGAGRRGALARLVGARVSRYCLAHAQCPVVAVPPGALAQEAGRGLRGWPFRRRSLSMDRFLRDGGNVTA